MKKALKALIYILLSVIGLYLLLLWGYRSWVDADWRFIDELSKTYEDRGECLVEYQKERCSSVNTPDCIENVESYCSYAFPE